MRLKNKLQTPAPAGKKPRRRFSPAAFLQGIRPHPGVEAPGNGSRCHTATGEAGPAKAGAKAGNESSTKVRPKSRGKACGERGGEDTGTWRTAESAVPSGIRTGKGCPCRIFRHACRDRIRGQGFYHVLKCNCYGTARLGAVK